MTENVGRISPQELRDLLHYDPETGVFRWRRDHGCKFKAGQVAGCTNPRGYRQLKLWGRSFLEHRLVWTFVHGEWPSKGIDHIDGNKSNNAIANLRLASTRQNQHNKAITSSNSTGFKGVHRRKDTRKWVAHIRVDGKLLYLGQYDNPEDAHAAYCAAATKHFGEFARLS